MMVNLGYPKYNFILDEGFEANSSFPKWLCILNHPFKHNEVPLLNNSKI